MPEKQVGLDLGAAEILWELFQQQNDFKYEISHKRNGGAKIHDLGNQIILYLKANIDKQLDMDQISTFFGMNKDYIRRTFKKATNQTLLQYHRKLQINKAIELMEKGELMISQIAYKIGYNDVNYFSRLFKKHMGYSPSEFRSKETKLQNIDGRFYPYVDRINLRE